MINTWLDEYQNELGALKDIVNPQQIQQQTNIEAKSLADYSHTVFSNFLTKVVNPIYNQQ